MSLSSSSSFSFPWAFSLFIWFWISRFHQNRESFIYYSSQCPSNLCLRGRGVGLNMTTDIHNNGISLLYHLQYQLERFLFSSTLVFIIWYLLWFASTVNDFQTLYSLFILRTSSVSKNLMWLSVCWKNICRSSSVTITNISQQNCEGRPMHMNRFQLKKALFLGNLKDEGKLLSFAIIYCSEAVWWPFCWCFFEGTHTCRYLLLVCIFALTCIITFKLTFALIYRLHKSSFSLACLRLYEWQRYKKIDGISLAVLQRPSIVNEDNIPAVSFTASREREIRDKKPQKHYILFMKMKIRSH